MSLYLFCSVKDSGSQYPGSPVIASTTTSSMADSSISRGASEDNKPWVAITKILYAPLSFRVSAAARKLSTSSMMSSCQIKDRAKGTSTLVKTGWTSRKKEEPGHLRFSLDRMVACSCACTPTALLGFSHKSPPVKYLLLDRELLAHSRPWEVGRSVGWLWNIQESFFFFFGCLQLWVMELLT